MGDFFYKPSDAWAADFIPFYADGRFRLFYLHDWRDQLRHGEGTPWYQVSTDDFVRFEEHGESLARGSALDQDLYVFTGSVLEAGGQYHIFYTGHNPHPREGEPPDQAVMHAASPDLLHWEKVREDTFFSPQDIYEKNDWRDPFVFWNAEAGEYWMLLAARLKVGPSRRRGCTALCTSADLKKWTVRPPFYSPGLFFTHECPDLFRMGDWWYLVFSEFSDRSVTRYRMSRLLSGPWLAPPDDCFDGRAFYAAKTWSDGSHRFIFGWNPTREGEKDYQAWHWGGSLVVHEVIQQADGRLSVRIPQSIDRAFSRSLPVVPGIQIGNWQTTGNALSCRDENAWPCSDENAWSCTAEGSFACIAAGDTPDCGSLSADILFSGTTRSCGIMLRASDDMEKAYYVRLEPDRQRLVLDSWPRNGDCPHMVELERPADLAADQFHHVQILVSGSVCEVYFDNRIAMSARLYDLKSGLWGFFVQEGSVRIENIQARGFPETGNMVP
jgi:beta-fructofuranosidase